MSANEDFDSSESSDFSDLELFFNEDVRNSQSLINKEWEAIERTLYEEPGPQITNPELLKECKLWRDTFPHFRVKGNKINEDFSSSKNIQTLDTHVDLKKVSEKREHFKNKVVKELVDRLMPKLKLYETRKPLQITEIKDEESWTAYEELNASNEEKESYYERGKSKENIKMSEPEKTINPDDIFGCLEDKPRPTNKYAIKPYEMTNKIDKKYEGILERIMQKRLSPSEGYKDNLDKIRINSGMEDNFRRNKNLPRLNQFQNNWMERGQAVSSFRQNMSSRNLRKTSKEFKTPQEDMDEQFIKDVKREMMQNIKRPPKRTGIIEEISLRRPKPQRNFQTAERHQKSFSCSDLPKKKVVRGKQMENEIKGKNITKMNQNNLKGGIIGNKNGLLPPIDTGIICTELKGYPKVSSCHSYNKKYK